MLGSTYTRELDAAVTTLGGGTPLLDVKVPVLATGGPDNADLVGDRVVTENACVSLRILSSRFFVVQAIRGSGAQFATRAGGRWNSRLAAPVGKSGLGHCVGVGRRVWSVIGGSLVVNPSQSMSLVASKFWSPERGVRAPRSSASSGARAFSWDFT